jgi:hypothetical protein
MINNTLFLVWLIPLAIWELAWKGVALWKCGRKNQLTWFVVILILNTMGILPIVYLLFFQKKEVQKKAVEKKVVKKPAKKKVVQKKKK